MHDTISTTASAPATVTSGGGGTLYLILTQIASRAFTFLGNQFLLSFLEPSLLGLAVQLELLSVTTLYFSRESLRVVLQRQSATTSTSRNPRLISQQIVNLAHLAVALGACVFVAFAYAYLQKASHEVLESLQFWPAFQLYAIATFVELFSEPCFVVIQQHALYKDRARAETAAAIARSAAACLAVFTMHKRRSPPSVLPFAIGQLAYAGTLLFAYLTAVVPVMGLEGFSLLPAKIASETGRDSQSSDFWFGLFSKSLISLTAMFYAQSIFKLLLTQGDTLVLSFLTDLRSQGAFALVSNYGGLLSRLVFQPVEESSRNIFGRLLDAQNGTSESEGISESTAKPDFTSNHKSSNRKPTDNNAADNATLASSRIHLAISHLSITLHIYTLLTLPILTLAPPLLPALTNLILTPAWRSSGTTALLSAYVHYIPFIAVNGVLDAFVTTVATPTELRTQSLVMAGVTAIYAGFAWVFMSTSNSAQGMRKIMQMGPAPLGSFGLVYANMVNMVLRIAYSIWFISGWLNVQPPEQTRKSTSPRKTWRRCLPATSCIVTAITVSISLRHSIPQTTEPTDAVKRFLALQGLSSQDVLYILSGAVVLVTSIFISERQFLVDVVMPLVPERIAGRIRPYLPKTKKEE